MAIAVRDGVHRFLLVLPLSAAAYLSACATALPVVRLTPESRDVVWQSGLGIVSAETGGVRVATAFAYQQGPLLAVRVKVENQSQEVITVEPAMLSFSTCKAACSERAPVVDPERMLVAIDLEKHQHSAQAQNDAALGETLVFLNVVSAIGSAASGSGRQAAIAASNAAVVAAETNVAVAGHQMARSALDTQRATLSSEALRITTLAPGQGTAGIVFLPANFGAQAVNLYLDLPRRAFEFRFGQRVFGSHEEN